MTDHHCKQEHKLGDMESKINRMDKELFNGEGGLIKIVPVLAKSVDNLNESVNDLRTVISGIKKYVFEDEGGKKREDDIKRTRLTNFKMFGIVMAGIVGLCSILGFIKSFANDKKVDDLDFKMHFKQDRIPDSTTRGGYIHYETLKDTAK